MVPFSSNAAYCSDWVHAPTALIADTRAMMDLLSTLKFDHDIRNWQAVFVTDPRVQTKILPREARAGSDIAVVFGVNLSAWDTPHPNLWGRAGFEDRARYIDDKLAMMRGDSNRQRDRAMRSVGMAAGFLLSKARDLKYAANFLHDFESVNVANEVGLPDSYQVAMIVTLKRAMKPLRREGENLVPVFRDGEGMFKLS